MKKIGKFTFTFLLVIAGAFVAVWAYSTFFDKPEVITVKEEPAVRYATLPGSGEAAPPDLTFAAENSIHAVVHIATQSVRGGGWTSGNRFWDEFFGLRGQPQVREGFGSGVILSEDGYIITNNHVIADAVKIKVILNDKREFEARLVGTDPSTDIALLKVEAENLSFLTFGDSDELKLGEWVLAVGNPFNLTSTVTAGIVSARARNLDLNTRNQYSIESFIQTDAAVNPGNSGGALVNQKGELVGINTLIASSTGSYTGYSFAVPVSIAKKVVEDLKEFGEVQRALLGVGIGDVNAEVAEELNLDKVEGVLILNVT
ncbi:MAG: trypsin-like peptidase domain-containing protein, partial [Draconibacterium sp.]|nr:trypsin-like peptidase domain-containing protein [Draconibacterium sp.]